MELVQHSPGLAGQDRLGHPEVGVGLGDGGDDRPLVFGAGSEEVDDFLLAGLGVAVVESLAAPGHRQQRRPTDASCLRQVQEELGVDVHEPGRGLGPLEVPPGPVDRLGDP